MPDAIQSIQAANIISTLSLDIDQPDKLTKLFLKYGNEGIDSFDIVRALGWMLPATQETYDHYEKLRFHSAFQDRNGTAAAATQAITLAISDLTTGNFFYPRVKDVVRYKNGKTGIITSINVGVPNAPVLTIETTTATNLPATAAGETITIISGTQAEGSKLQKGAWTLTTKRSFKLQIIPERFDVTGTEMTNRKWFDVLSDGTGIPKFYLLGQREAEYRLKLKICGMQLWGEQNTTTIVDPDSATSAAYATSGGLVPAIINEGHNLPYPTGLLSVNNFDAISRQLNKENAGTDIMVWCGFDFNVQKDNVLIDYFKNTNTTYTRERMTKTYFKGHEGLAQSVNFSILDKSNFSYMFINMPPFSNVTLGGAAGFRDSETALFIPMKGQKTQEGDVPSVGLRYKSFGGYNRMNEMFTLAGAGGNPQSYVKEEDLSTLMLRAHVGGHYVAVNQMARLFPN